MTLRALHSLTMHLNPHDLHKLLAHVQSPSSRCEVYEDRIMIVGNSIFYLTELIV